MSRPLNIAIAGLGTVGVGLVQLLERHGDKLKRSCGREIRIAAVSARARNKDRGIDLSRYQWFDDPVALATAPGIDLFIELIGGENGTPKAAVEAALASGKHVVTANKALLAKHGTPLAAMAEARGLALNFEAAVAGGIPIIKTMREALAGNEIQRIYGILNGTCNYILSRMTDQGLAFEVALAEAQAKGYAEADPTFDIGGYDAAHKLTLLTALAFGTKVAFDQIHVEGIEKITKIDIEAAQELGYAIKLLGVAVRTVHGIEHRVHPALIPEDSALAEVSGVTNAVAVDADFAGNLLLVGPGAGAKPTASAVASDIIDIAAGFVLPPFGVPVAQLSDHHRVTLGEHHGGYYVRLTAYDKPGVMASITARMAEQDVSLESIVQKGPRAGRGAQASVVIITHETTEQSIRKALDSIEADGKVAEKPQMIRIEPL